MTIKMTPTLHAQITRRMQWVEQNEKLIQLLTRLRGQGMMERCFQIFIDDPDGGNKPTRLQTLEVEHEEVTEFLIGLMERRKERLRLDLADKGIELSA